MVARRVVDAMIISATQRIDKRIDLLVKAKIPFVALGRSSSGGNFTWIDLDFEGVATCAVDRLVAKGHRRIAIAAPSGEINLGYVFVDAYRKALEKHGIEYDPDLVIRVKSSEQGGYQAGDGLLLIKERPTAIILIYELMAIGLHPASSKPASCPAATPPSSAFAKSPAPDSCSLP
jgi:DNA-binding LacI/PurR family transcriptional regulator